ncbi:MAG TPA: hypothetical protein DEQ38_08120 [Elusimicrobia bacterium]|nr:MAG: hypothetical protein A2089_03265 [Elusimicrobia bacterium GWD2_63_28]HCC48061.1 hypothetical protein [Elusimicrobiota bacterium]
MQKNLILAVVLSSLVYVGWYTFVEKKIQPQRQQAAQQQAQAASPQAQAPAQPAYPAAQAEPAPLPANWKDKAIKIKAGKAEYTFNAETASLASAVYQGPVAPVELVPDPQRGFFYASFPGKFTLKSKTEKSVEFVSQQGPLRITKKFTFTPENGVNYLEMEAVNTSGSSQALAPWELRIGPGLDTVESEMKENKSELKAVYTFSETGRKHPTLKEVEDDEPARHDWVWAGLSNRYFLAAFASPSFKDTRPIRRDEKVGENDETPLLAVPMRGVELKPGEKIAWTTLFYLGPKDYALLQKVGLGLDRAVDFGFFAPLAKLANSSLIYFYKATGNYGVAIIILSVIIQLLLTPLSFKSYKAMAVMKKIQPEMQAIQKRYKEDPQRMNKEIMDLYKRHGTNPLGGCLPMLLQIPVFFALFTALRNSWDLHGAAFVFWIKDLSSKDPFYVMPLVMGGIMFLQQHLSPQTSDPAQATMMKFMPLIFTFMFLTFPSGLVLYWLINSTWGFAQTMYLQKKMG